MRDDELQINLGFTPEPVPAGTHICQIYDHDDERNRSLLLFLLQGLKSQESCASFTHNFPIQHYEDFFSRHDISLPEITASGAFDHAEVNDVYFKGGRFDEDRMLDSLKAFHTKAMAAGFRSSRVIGEMTPEIEKGEGVSRLLDYELRVTRLQEEYPVTAVCQYCARHFEGETIAEVMKVHPMMYVGGVVIRNPFYIDSTSS